MTASQQKEMTLRALAALQAAESLPPLVGSYRARSGELFDLFAEVEKLLATIPTWPAGDDEVFGKTLFDRWRCQQLLVTALRSLLGDGPSLQLAQSLNSYMSTRV